MVLRLFIIDCLPKFFSLRPIRLLNANSLSSMWSPHLLRVFLVFFITIISIYIFSICIKQTSIQRKPDNTTHTLKNRRAQCDLHAISPEEQPYVHFPQPKTYARGECSCSPVRFFVILSMQRSGSGWFETLLNSHPNISSNGEIFLVWERRNNISSIKRTLDIVFNLEWSSSASKNECVAAVGFKWMLNQGIMDHYREILDYFKLNGVSVIFLFRRNLLRRLISLLANDYDRRTKQLNGTHKSHVHSREEAEILARFKPVINTEVLVSNLSQAEKSMADCLQLFSSTRHIILYYEDIIGNHSILSHVQEFLGLPQRKLKSLQVKIHTRPLSDQVVNWEDVMRTLRRTKYGHFLYRTNVSKF